MENDITNPTHANNASPTTPQTIEPEKPKTNNKLNKKIVFFTIFLVVILLIIIPVFGYHLYQNNLNTETALTKQENETSNSVKFADVDSSKKYTVIVKDNPNDNTLTNIYLKEEGQDYEILYGILSEVYSDHYHTAEFHNGNLYIIHRTGGNQGYVNNPNWKDELWRYNQKGEKEKLYSSRGLDFRVANDESIISAESDNNLVVIDKAGNILKTFNGDDLVTTIENKNPSIQIERVSSEYIWLDQHFGPTTIGLTKIDLTNYEVKKFDLSKLTIGIEFALNTERELIAFTNYPAIFDEEGLNKFLSSQSEINLTLYYLNNKIEQIIATYVTKQFSPMWIDKNTLEYNNSAGDGKLLYSLEQ